MNLKFIHFDLETTGCQQSGSILNKFHRILQISAVSGEDEFNQLVHPEVHIPSESTAIHRVTNELVANKPNFGTVFPLFRKFIKNQTKRGTQIVLVAHNAFGFDKPMLEKECSRFGLRIPSTWVFYDTLLTFRKQFPDLVSKKLGDLHELRFGEPIAGAHDALADSQALQRLFNHDIVQYFTLTDTLAPFQQRYLTDNESVINIRGVGQRTVGKISHVLQTDHPTVGQLRTTLMSQYNITQIEQFIRTVLGTYKEEFVFSILCEIVQPSQPHLVFKDFPFCLNTFNSNTIKQSAIEKLQTMQIRSPVQLKRHYLFVLKENGQLWDNLLRDLDLRPFYISMVMRSL